MHEELRDLLLSQGWAYQERGQIFPTEHAVWLRQVDQLLIVLAEWGYFPSPEDFLHLMTRPPTAALPLDLFAPHPYHMRHPTIADLEALVALEVATWPENLCASRAEIQQRVVEFPTGHIVAVLAQQVVGVVYTQRIADATALLQTDFRAVAALHTPDGSTVQLLAANVLPAVQQYALGDHLLAFMLQLCTVRPGIARVVGVTRCKNYPQHSDLTLAAYIQLRTERGQYVDPVLNFHAAHGAQISRVIEGYRPPDQENLGAGVLVTYDDLRGRLTRRQEARRTDPVAPPAITAIPPLVDQAVCAVLGSARALRYTRRAALRELGLDSVELLELRLALHQLLGRELAPTLFFRYPTPESLIGYLQQEQAVLLPQPVAPLLATPVPESRFSSVDEPAGLPQSDATIRPPTFAGAAEPIAIVGMACRFPGGVTSPTTFWSLLANGVDAISEVPADRWDMAALYGDQPGQIRTPYGGFLDHVADFDAPFFRIAPVEVAAMDPQQRLLLETHWEALEYAGINPETLKGSATGIYVGIFGDDYKLVQARQADLSTYYGTGTANAVAAGRIAYFLGTAGPAMAVDTACSSSLVAVHLACQSLRSGESTLALASGVNLLLSPELSIAFSQANMLAPDGRCKTFDAAADGYVRSEGCGVVVLKRLADAQAADDTILALIRGTAINQDGASNGLTAPNGLAQAAVIRQALAVARLQPHAITYVEAHGTGTSLGDPIEIHALETVYGQERGPDNPLIVGSVKTNIGHTEAAAGIAGLLKVVLSFQHGVIPPHLHLRALNPLLATAAITIPTQAQPWPQPDPTQPLRAAVSSFGFSGTNAHVILEAAPPAVRPTQLRRPAHLLTLSAQSEAALHALAQQYAAALPKFTDADLPAIATTSNRGRAHFSHRLALVAATVEEAQSQLVAFTHGQIIPSLFQGYAPEAGATPKIAFLFTGQGSQYLQMGHALYLTEPTFRAVIDRCDLVLRDYLGRSLLELLYPATPPEHHDLLESHPCGQAVNFALECALADVWRSWGVQPTMVLGHSLGDFAAAYTAGVISLEDGLRLVTERGRLMETARGRMVAVQASESEVAPFLSMYADVIIGVINGPQSVVVSGGREHVAEVAAQLLAADFKIRPLDIPVAAHSPMLDPVLDAFVTAIRMVRLAPPRLPVVSSMTGQLVSSELTDPGYWRQHLRNTIRFADGMLTLREHGCSIFVEIGPKPTLLGMAGLVLDELAQGEGTGLAAHALMLPSLRDDQGDTQQMLLSLGALYAQGVAIDWAGVERRRQTVALPTYPFQRQRHWLEPNNRQPTPVAAHGAATGAGLLYEVAWERQPWPMTGTVPLGPGRWLILADAGGVGAALAELLRALGEMVDLTTDAAGLTERIASLVTQPDSLPLRGVVHLWALDYSEYVDLDAINSTALAAIQERNLGSVVQLVQTCVTLAGTAPRLWVGTQYAQQLTATQPVAVAHVPLWGLGRVIGLEHGERWGGLVDLDLADEPAEQARALLAELWQSRSAGETEVAYRGGTRYVARLVRSKLTLASQPSGPIHADACYLITGGLGGLGLLVAQMLADQGARQLILIGRRAVPNAHAQAVIAGLEERGVTVEIAPVDVADAAAMAQLFAAINAGAHPLKGVFHTAGVLDDGLLLHQNWERFAQALAAKVTGAWLLHQLTRSLDLDLMVFFSSVVALLGNVGQASYAAANAFLDGLARQRCQQGLPALSINWGIWDKVGMAMHAGPIAFAGVQPMPPATAIHALARLLSCGGQIGVASVDWAVLAAANQAPRPFLTNLVAREPTASSDTPTSLVAELVALPPQRRLSHMQTYLQQVVGQLLGMADLPDSTTGFADLGMDSLMSLELRRRLERSLARALPTTIAFEYPRIAALADYLLSEILVLAEPVAVAAPVSARTTDVHEPIAVISMACRFPGADTPEAFWQLLQDGGDMVREIPAVRWDVHSFYDPQRPMRGKMYTREAAFVDHAEQFDPLFFGIAPREVATMDPQHWLLLEVSWEALERAGIAPSTLIDSQTGVFVGIGVGNYGSMNDPRDLVDLDSYAITSGGHSIAAGRLAYMLGLQGPTLAVDTACSSSLVALHLACQSLRSGECDLALAGGVSLMLTPTMHVALSQMQVLAPDGRCKAFDAAADGYGRGEGGGMVVLKRLSAAQADGDQILAVISGSAINHDGPSSGLTVPNKRAQEKLLRQALANAQVMPNDVAYIETHGTGTPLGDPIEIRALGAVFGVERPIPLLVGTVKSNVGHLEAAAGIAGFIKTVLAVQHGQIPRQLHFHTPNPYIEWDAFAIEVPTISQPWPDAGSTRRRIAGVSSFGISGTNAHVIVEAAPAMPTPGRATLQPDRSHQILTLSAKSAAALSTLAARYLAHVQRNPALDLGDLCATATLGRNHFSHRLGLVAESVTTLQASLQAVVNGDDAPEIICGSVAHPSLRIAFLFTGQGSQYVEMGRDLYATQPVFRATLDRCDRLLRPHLGESLLAILYPQGAAPSRIDQTRFTQPALFALEYALATLWQSWGVQPDLLIGHSVGELVAACVAGVFSLEDGLKLIAARGRLMDALPHDGEMIALLADEAVARRAIAPWLDDVSLAAVNGPQSVVISGRREAVQAIVEQVTAQGIKTRRLMVSHAFHSPLMDPMLEAFHAIAASITYHQPCLPLISNVTGALTSAELLTPAYWVRHVREAVRFADGVTALREQGASIFLEIGPHPTLLGMAGQHDGSGQLTMLPSLWREQPDWQQMLSSLSALYVRGVPINWAEVAADAPRRNVVLPTYPFQRKPYWVNKPAARRATALRPLIDTMTRLPLHDELVFETKFSLDRLPFLAEHRVFGAVVSPGACQLAIALSAASLTLGQEQNLCLKEIVFPRALVLPDAGSRIVQTVLRGAATNGHGPHDAFTLISFDPDAPMCEPVTHAMGQLARSASLTQVVVDLAALRERCRQPGDIPGLYTRAAAAQIELGASFRWLAELWHGPAGTAAEALGKLVLPAAVGHTTGHLLHPGLLDACFQVATMARAETSAETLLPFAVGTLRFHQPTHGDSWWCHAILTGSNSWDIRLLDAQGTLLAEIAGFEMRPATPEAIRRKDAWRDWLYEVVWQRCLVTGHVPEYLPAPTSIAQELQSVLPLRWPAASAEQHQARGAMLETVSVEYVLAAFAKAGFIFQPDTRWRTEQIARQVGVIPFYQRLLERLLAILAEEGVLRREQDAWYVVNVPPTVDPARRVALIQAAHGTPPELRLLMNCGERVGEVLRGVQEPLELLFPGGDTDVARQLYAESPIHQLMNDLVQHAVQHMVAQLPAERELRVLEIGGGTGGTTAGLLPLFPATQTEYHFTDIGMAFLKQAQTRFGGYPFVHYQTLDIEQPPIAQGFGRYQADLVVAANVLHATRDLPTTLSHVRQLLQPGGQLILLEVTSRNYWVDLTFGLLDGWWRFADQRQDHPLLTATQWKELLHAHGFPQVAVVEQGGHALIIAQAASTPDPILTTEPGPTWLLFADTQGIGDAIATRLRQQGDRPILISAGEMYDPHEDALYIQIRPDCAADYQRVLAAFPTAQGIIHLWSLDTPPPQAGADLVRAMEQSCGTLLLLVQALVQSHREPTGLWCVTRAAQAVITSDAVQGVVQASLWGMGRVIDQEHPELNCVRVDLGAADTLDTVVSQLCAEFNAMPAQTRREQQIALRDGARYLARLNRFTPQARAGITCDPTATYLITGGLGGLGLATAAWLVAQGARHLVLAGRSQPNDAAQAQVAALRAQGVAVTVARCDVTRRADLQQLFDQIDPAHPLRGIIHSVGVLDDGVLLHQNWERFANVLAPKIQGAWHLHEMTKGLPLDFFVLFSAAAGLLGNRGQANHAAANTFLDAFAAFRRAQGLPALALDWGAWSEIGAAAELMRQSQAELVARGLGAMAPSAGIAALAGLIGQPTAQVGVMAINWQTYLQGSAAQPSFFTTFLDQTSHAEANQTPANRSAAQATIRQQMESVTRAERAALLSPWLQQLVARTLHLPELPHPQVGFSEMGMDSLMTIEFRRLLKKELQVALPSTLAFEYPTIELLGQYLLHDVLGGEDRPVDTQQQQSGDEQDLTDLDTLSDDDLNKLLAQELALLDEVNGTD